jgi:hypothetical protein
MIHINSSEIKLIEGYESRDQQLLEAALLYAKSGVKVLPLAPNSKEPVDDNWKEIATRDPALINRWFGPNGPHRGGNIALMVDGFKVLDVDRHPGKPDGFKTLGDKLKGISGPSATTPQNGKHYLLNKTELVSGDGYDVLGDGKLFTVFPSRIDGRVYTWETGGLPGKLRELQAVKPAEGMPVAVEALAPGPYVVGLLESIDPDCDYDVWLKIGMAVHHNDAGYVGFMAWDEWSKKGTKYKDGETETKWRGFDANRNNTVTIRWLIKEAIRCGKPLTNEDRLYWSGIDFDIHIDRLNEKYGVYDNKGALGIVYMENGDLHVAAPRDWAVKMMNDRILVGNKDKPMSEIWLQSPDRREIKKIGMWESGKEPPQSINMWTGFAIKPIECEEDDIRVFLDFMLEVLCRGNTRYYGFLCDMLTLKFNDPLAVHNLCLVLRGGEGVGKGVFTSTIENIIGRRHSINVSSGKWLGQFSGSLISGKVWISANETHWSGNHAEAERLKGLVTEREIDIESKYVNAWRAENYLMIAITTNNKWAVPASIDSRRFFVLDVDGKYYDDAEYWERLIKLVGENKRRELNNPEYLGKILYYFQNRKIINKMHRAMETTWLKGQQKVTAVGSDDDAFVMWVKEVVMGDRSSGTIVGASGKYFPIMKMDDDEVVGTDGMYTDFLKYARNYNARAIFRVDADTFSRNMAKLGMKTIRVRKARLTAGGRPITGNGDSKTRVAILLSAEEIQRNINKEFALFAEEMDDESEGDS